MTTAPQCEHCGRCLSVCPVYLEERTETLSPRGRLDLIQSVAQGGIAPGPRYREALSSCLQCLACAQACPKGVDGPGLIREEKARQLDDAFNPGHYLESSLLKLALDNRERLSKLASAAARVNGSLPGQARHLPLFLPQALAGKQIPTPARKNIHQVFEPVILPEHPIRCPARPVNQVILFTGCFFGFVDTTPAIAAVKVLTANGITVHIPPAQACCGAPADLSGHAQALEKSARKNLELFRSYPGNADNQPLPILTLCATCGNALKNDYPKRFPKSDTAQALTQRVVDISQFLTQLSGFSPGPKALNQSTTVHRPCHLNRGMESADAVEQLLSKLPGLDLIPMENPDACCGGGGICALKNHEISRILGDRKAAQAAQTQAEMVVTPCPGCTLQLQERLGAAESSMAVVHPIELLADTYS